MIGWFSRRGFSLVEILMASITFTVILMGLATTFQSGVTSNNAIQDLGDSQQALRDAVRLIAEGDSLLPNPHEGLFLATRATQAAAGRLQYQANGQTYEIWIAGGQLLRQVVGQPSTLRVLAGEAVPAGTLKNRLVFSPDTNAGNPVAALTVANNAPNAAVRFAFTMHRDRDGDGFPTGTEVPLTIRPTIFLRNSEN